MELIFENVHGGVRYDRKRQILQYKFVGMVRPELVKEVTGAGLKFAATNKVTGSTADLSELSGTFTALNDYLINEYFPPMIQKGLICHAIIVPHDIFTRFAANALLQRMGDFTMRTFDNDVDAIQWVYEMIGVPVS
ncbi:MAG: hypothetical protein ACFB10_11515 [Salibacteraceae bacterium]